PCEASSEPRSWCPCAGSWPPQHLPVALLELTELRVAVPEAGKRLLPLPVAAWHATVGSDR
ncbi:MAG: hypothetical protein ACXWF5_07975, partial [Actinomycetota bacterium]